LAILHDTHLKDVLTKLSSLEMLLSKQYICLLRLNQIVEKLMQLRQILISSEKCLCSDQKLKHHKKLKFQNNIK